MGGWDVIQLLGRDEIQQEARISDDQHERQVIESRQPKSIVQFFRESPLADVELDFKRDDDSGRDIDL